MWKCPSCTAYGRSQPQQDNTNRMLRRGPIDRCVFESKSQEQMNGMNEPETVEADADVE